MVAGSRWVSGDSRVGTRGARGRSLGRRCATQPPSPNSRNGCRASFSGPPSQQRPAAGRSRQSPGSCRAPRRSQRFAVSPRSLFGAESPRGLYRGRESIKSQKECNASERQPSKRIFAHWSSAPGGRRRAGRAGTFSGSGARQERGAGRSGARRSWRISTVGVRKRALAASRHFFGAIVDARKSRFGRNSGQGPPHHTPVAGGVGSVPRVPPGWVVWWAGPWPES